MMALIRRSNEKTIPRPARPRSQFLFRASRQARPEDVCKSISDALEDDSETLALGLCPDGWNPVFGQQHAQTKIYAAGRTCAGSAIGLLALSRNSTVMKTMSLSP